VSGFGVIFGAQGVYIRIADIRH